jgi:DNA-directed RNA polymerase specialized sigma24 family protein
MSRRRKGAGKSDLAKAVLRLPTGLRDVFLLHRLGGRSYEQIAERLGVERDEVQARLAEALIRVGRAVDSAGG